MARAYDLQDPAEREVGIKAAVACARRGELVVLPLESVYGLATDAFSVEGVGRLRTAQHRGLDVPVPVMVGSPRTVDGLVISLGPDGRDLVEAFWPGPLSIVARAHPSLRWDLGDARGTVTLRMPLHPVALEVLRETGPLAVASANRAGLPATRTVAEARSQLGDEVSAYLDAGACEPGEPSTVVDLTGDAPVLLREGALPLALLLEVVPGLMEPPGAG